MLGFEEISGGAIATSTDAIIIDALQVTQFGLEFAWALPAVDMMITQVGLELAFDNGPAMQISQFGLEIAFVNPIVTSQSAPMMAIIV